MKCTEIMKARVPKDFKVRAKELADRDLVTEATWLRHLVIRELRSTDNSCSSVAPEQSVRRGCISERRKHRASRPVLVRLNPEDRLLLEARAQARGMRSATYLSVLTRAHLRQLAPLPQDELRTLKRSIGELAAIGRNINQITKASNEGRVPPSVREEFRAILKVCEALRDNTKTLLLKNVTSWEVGYEDADS